MQYYHHDTYGTEAEKNTKASQTKDVNVESAQTVNTSQDDWNKVVKNRETGTFKDGSHA